MAPDNAVFMNNHPEDIRLALSSRSSTLRGAIRMSTSSLSRPKLSGLNFFVMWRLCSWAFHPQTDQARQRVPTAAPPIPVAHALPQEGSTLRHMHP